MCMSYVDGEKSQKINRKTKKRGGAGQRKSVL